jgi:thiol-disulfide isomerase/thioredoxin
VDPRESVLTKKNFRKYVEKIVDEIPSTEPLSKAEIEQFIHNPFSKGQNALLFISMPGCGHCTKLSPIVGLSAQQLKIPLNYVEGKVLNEVLQSSEFQNSPLRVDGYPMVFLFKNNSKIPILVQAGSGVTVDEFIKKVNEKLASESLEISQSQPRVLESRRAVHRDSDSSRDSPTDSKALLDGTGDFSTDYVLMVWAPWCGACTAIKPKFLEAIAKLKGDQNLNHIPMFLMQADSNKQFMMNNGLNAIPAILKMRGNKIVDQFVSPGGMPTADSIIDWIRNQ